MSKKKVKKKEKKEQDVKARVLSNLNSLFKNVKKAGKGKVLASFAIVVTEDGYDHYLIAEDSKGAYVLLGYSDSILKVLSKTVDRAVSGSILNNIGTDLDFRDKSNKKPEKKDILKKVQYVG